MAAKSARKSSRNGSKPKGAPTRKAPQNAPEPALNAVIVVVERGELGQDGVGIQLSGDVRLTEVATLLEMALATARQQITIRAPEQSPAGA